ncbi:MAG: M20/M25/M40 family metallo-hydrolase [Pseudomonadota bacterium]
MRIRLILAAIALGLAPAAALAQAAPPRAPAEPVFTAEGIKAHVDFLADDLLEGRDAGTRGHEIAARYVATRFEALGLKPGGTNGGWYQQMPLAVYSLDADAPASVMVGDKKFENRADVLIAASPRSGDGLQTVTAAAVFVGYGEEADYAGLDVKGKFAVMLVGTPKGQDAAKEDRGIVARDHGAAGILYVLSDLDARKMNWAAAGAYFTREQTNWLGPNGAPNGIDPGVKIGGYVKATAAAALFAGSPMTAEQVFAAAAAPDGARPKGFALKPRVTVTRTNRVRIVETPNVIGILPGADPRLASEYVVLSAHLDHEGTDPNLPGPDKIYNGAMDNAAGVATMLEAARAFAESGKRPKRSILFVALTAEEDGLLGSDYLAHYPVVGSGRVVADVNLDMPILLYDFKDVVAFGAEHSTLGPIVSRAAARMGVTLSPDPVPEEQLFVRSDHYSFVKAGVPSVFLVTGFANGGEKAFRDFLAHNYHKVSDQSDQPINWQAGAKFAQINYLIAREIADGAEAPRWYEGNSFGDRYAPGQPRAPAPPPPAPAKP